MGLKKITEEENNRNIEKIIQDPTCAKEHEVFLKEFALKVLSAIEQFIALDKQLN